MIESSCFLCAPDADLMVFAANSVFAMVGLGPISSTYAIITSHKHVRSLADLAVENPRSTDDIVDLRRRIQIARGPLVMTEHGRVPVCREQDEHEHHCYHAHALLFAVDGAALDPARGYYSHGETFDSLGPALEFAANRQAYLLISRTDDSYEVLHGPLNTPRQLARTLAALGADQPSSADWRIHPRRPEALAMADSIRSSMGVMG